MLSNRLSWYVIRFMNDLIFCFHVCVNVKNKVAQNAHYWCTYNYNWPPLLIRGNVLHFLHHQTCSPYICMFINVVVVLLCIEATIKSNLLRTTTNMKKTKFSNMYILALSLVFFVKKSRVGNRNAKCCSI